MKTLLCCIIACLSLAAFAGTPEEDLPKLLIQCDSEDFDVREQATFKLGQFPAEYVEKFLTMAETEQNPEVGYRLKYAARLIFEKKIGSKDDRWRYFHGTLELTGQLVWVTKETHLDADFPYYHTECEVLGMLVSWVNDVDGPGKDKIRQSDLILSIEGSSLNPINVKADGEYVVHIRRYKSLKYIEDHNTIDPNATEKDYDEFTVTVTASWLDRRFINEYAEQDLMTKLWLEYLEGRKK